MKTKYLFLLLLLHAFSCKKDSETTPANSFLASPGGLYISNEGVFQSGNASISYFNPDQHTVVNNVFQLTNSESIGDICQSMALINNNLYIVVNNSGKIEVCDPFTMKRKAQITGLTSPRYILAVDSTKAYVSDLYSNAITIINTTNNSIQGSIPLTGSSEQILLLNNKVYVTNSLSDYIYAINSTNDLIEDSLLISKGANSIRIDKYNKLWVTCGGDYVNVQGAVYRIDPSSKNIEFSSLFTITDYPAKVCLNAAKDTVYFLNNGVQRMNVTDNTYPATPFIASSGNTYYGLTVDSVRNEIYVSDAINFSQAGKVFRYSSSGNLIDNFNVGISPGDFLFLR